MALFKDLNLDETTLQAIEKMGFEEATPIQEEVIPLGKQGRDIVGQAQTGTGKTVAFGIPCIERMSAEKRPPQALVLTPTRELANQVAEELNKLGRPKGITALPIYGGQAITRQISALKRHPQIIVATPGRYMDHMRRKTIKPEHLNMIILDEADEMLSMGFIEDIETILQEVPSERQTLLFSATMPPKLKAISSRFMNNPVSIAVKAKQLTVENIDQRYMVMAEKEKFDVLCNLLDKETPDLAIIFGRTKRRVDELMESLSIRGFAVDGLHGDMKQERRDLVIRKFKHGAIDIMVATDVAARGLDVNDVSHVINFDLPQDSESYVHRIGRTGRAGKKGISYSFVTPRETDHLRYIEASTKKKMTEIKPPTYTDALEGRHEQAVNELRKAVEAEGTEQLEAEAGKLLEDFDAITLVSAALKMVTKEPSKTKVKITGEAPARSKRGGGGGGKRGGSGGGGGGGNRTGGGYRGGRPTERGGMNINAKKRTGKKDRDRSRGSSSGNR